MYGAYEDIIAGCGALLARLHKALSGIDMHAARAARSKIFVRGRDPAPIGADSTRVVFGRVEGPLGCAGLVGGPFLRFFLEAESTPKIAFFLLLVESFFFCRSLKDRPSASKFDSKFNLLLVGRGTRF